VTPFRSPRRRAPDSLQNCADGRGQRRRSRSNYDQQEIIYLARPRCSGRRSGGAFIEEHRPISPSGRQDLNLRPLDPQTGLGVRVRPDHTWVTADRVVGSSATIGPTTLISTGRGRPVTAQPRRDRAPGTPQPAARDPPARPRSGGDPATRSVGRRDGEVQMLRTAPLRPNANGPATIPGADR
jgi:hypothetical protein